MTIELKETQALQNMQIETTSIGWDLSISECGFMIRSVFAGITDYLALIKNKEVPQVVLVQDLKGNNICYACVKYEPNEDASEEDDDPDAAGSWEYYWSFDCKTYPENATVYLVDQEPVQRTIARRGHNLCGLVVGVLSYISAMAVMTFNVIKDTLDQQDINEGDEPFMIEDPGFFDASVEVVDGKKVFNLNPKGEMKALIKKDETTEAAEK